MKKIGNTFLDLPVIQITKTKVADSRFKGDGVLNKESLLNDSKTHISDVQKCCNLFCNALRRSALKHDFTKLDSIDLFLSDFLNLKPGKQFKSGKWWPLHLKERHHLRDNVPPDVNLIDILEMIADCVSAWRGRSSKEYIPIKLSSDVLQTALENTQKVLIEHTK